MPFCGALVVVIIVELGQGDTTLKPDYPRLQERNSSSEGFKALRDFAIK
jgi:hypothetical protein